MKKSTKAVDQDKSIEIDMSKTVARRHFLSLTSGLTAGLATAIKAPWLLAGGAGAASLFPVLSHAAEHTVSAMAVKFEPVFVYIEPGDRVDWVNMIGHLIETIDSMVPEGTEKVITEMGKDVSHTFDKEGIYVYKCTPHWGARMGGIIVVGKPEDPVAILDGYLATLETEKENLPAKGLIKKIKKDMEAKGLI